METEKYTIAGVVKTKEGLNKMTKVCLIELLLKLNSHYIRISKLNEQQENIINNLNDEISKLNEHQENIINNLNGKINILNKDIANLLVEKGETITKHKKRIKRYNLYLICFVAATIAFWLGFIGV